MARTKRIRKYYKQKGRWSANIQEINNVTISSDSVAGSFSATTTLATNPAQNTLGVSQTYTVKNMEVNFTIEGGNNRSLGIEGVTCYIMYVPQGMNITENFNLEHPEYIMTYKFLGSPNIENNTLDQNRNVPQNFQPFKIKTRMARRLQTGDSIILYIKAHTTQANAEMRLNGLIRWWTKAN